MVASGAGRVSGLRKMEMDNKPYVIEKVRKDGVSVGHLRSSTGDWFSFNLRRMAERLADLTERNDPDHYYIVKKI